MEGVVHDPKTLLARGLALLWAAFWLLFFVLESLAWQTPVAVMAPWVAGGLLFAALAVAAWRWEFGGGLLLALVGVAAGVAYAAWSPQGLPAGSRLATALVLGVPPVLAGLLFVQHGRGVTRHHQRA